MGVTKRVIHKVLDLIESIFTLLVWNRTAGHFTAQTSYKNANCN